MKRTCFQRAASILFVTAFFLALTSGFFPAVMTAEEGEPPANEEPAAEQETQQPVESTLVYSVGPDTSLPGLIPPKVTRISTVEQLESWYQDSAALSTPLRCVLTEPITVDFPLTLGECQGSRIIDTGSYRIEVSNGGELVIDNPRLEIIGVDQLFRVRDLGKLSLLRGKISPLRENYIAVMLLPGAVFSRTEEFLVGQIFGESWEESPPSIIGGAALTTWPLPLIQGLEGQPLPPLPERVDVLVRGGTTSQSYRIKVCWDAAFVEPTTAGVYTVTGTLEQSDLERLGFTDPDGLTIVQQIMIRKPGPIDTMIVDLVNISPSSLAVIELIFPDLPNEVEAVYLYWRSETGDWKKETYSGWDGENSKEEDNFLERCMRMSPNTFLVHRLNVGHQPAIWFRLFIEGSTYEGYSNEFMLELPGGNGMGSVSKPEEPPESKPDDGSQGGNRGGGGQGVTDRDWDWDWDADEAQEVEAAEPQKETESSPAVSSEEESPTVNGMVEHTVQQGIPDLSTGEEETPVVPEPKPVPKQTVIQPTVPAVVETPEPQSPVPEEAALPSMYSRGILVAAVATVCAGAVLLVTWLRKRVRK